MDKLKLCCSECGFVTTEPEVFVDHMLLTGHVCAPGMVKADGGDLAEIIRAIGTIQADPQGRQLPEGMTMRPVSLEELEDDPTLPEEEKVKIRRFFDKADEKE